MGKVVLFVVMDDMGEYCFSDLFFGVYSVQFGSGVDGVYWFIGQNVGFDDVRDSDVDVSFGCMGFYMINEIV